MKIPESLLTKIKEIQGQITLCEEAHNQKSIEVKNCESKEKSLWASMSFTERNFAGWFGGDKMKVRSYELLVNETIPSLRAEGTALNSTKTTLGREIDEFITRFLIEQNVQEFNNAWELKEATLKIKNETDDFINKITNAISDVDSAQGMETIDLFTDSEVASVLSWSENNSASSSIDDVKIGIKHFENVLNDFVLTVKASNINPSIRTELENIDDTMDTVIDFAWDGFDFSSLFTLSSLSTAEDQLEQLLNNVKQIHAKVLNQHLAVVKFVDQVFNNSKREILLQTNSIE